jgi:hypothetical protein
MGVLDIASFSRAAAPPAALSMIVTKLTQCVEARQATAMN